VNALAILEVEREHGSFEAYLWSFAPPPRERRLSSLEEIPAETEESRTMSRALRKRGFSFVGPTICYAFMQSAGLVDDHLATCFRAEELSS
jgi:DNA-3-methyladenine glycosylase I